MDRFEGRREGGGGRGGRLHLVILSCLSMSNGATAPLPLATTVEKFNVRLSPKLNL